MFLSINLDTISLQYLIPLGKQKDLWKQTINSEQETGS